jgi:outer membrane protein OmpA-like peptidoglycan-associated protein
MRPDALGPLGVTANAKDRDMRLRHEKAGRLAAAMLLGVGLCIGGTADAADIKIGGENGVRIGADGITIGNDDNGVTVGSEGQDEDYGQGADSHGYPAGHVYQTYDGRGKDLRGMNLAGSEFLSSDLSGANLEGMDLRGVIFQGTDLSGANLANANLEGAEFNGSDLRGANLSGACLLSSYFRGSAVDGVNASGAYLVDVTLIGVQLSNVNTSGAVVDGPYRCPRRHVAAAKPEKAARPSVTTSRAIEEALQDPGQGRIDLTVNFATDSDKIRGDAHAQVFEIAKALKSPVLETAEIMIEGHTDSQGDDAYNLDLSYRRAIAVMRALSETHGVDSRRLSVRGYGERQPMANNETPSGRALNRRVELVNLSVQ